VRPSARLMEVPEVDLTVEYFHQSTLEYLETLGPDPTRVLDAPTWKARFAGMIVNQSQSEKALAVVCEMGGEKVGFSAADKITFGSEARIHSHVFCSDQRAQGLGMACVKLTIQSYFETLNLKRIFVSQMPLTDVEQHTSESLFQIFKKRIERYPAVLTSIRRPTDGSKNRTRSIRLGREKCR
jgi:hypothetical protein